MSNGHYLPLSAKVSVFGRVSVRHHNFVKAASIGEENQF